MMKIIFMIMTIMTVMMKVTWLVLQESRKQFSCEVCTRMDKPSILSKKVPQLKASGGGCGDNNDGSSFMYLEEDLKMQEARG